MNGRLRQQQVCDPLRCSGLHACYNVIDKESYVNLIRRDRGNLKKMGDREVEGHTLAVRTRSGKDLGSHGLDELTAWLCEEVASRGRLVLEDRLSQRRSA